MQDLLKVKYSCLFVDKLKTIKNIIGFSHLFIFYIHLQAPDYLIDYPGSLFPTSYLSSLSQTSYPGY